MHNIKRTFSLSNIQKPFLHGLSYCKKTTEFIRNIVNPNKYGWIFLLFVILILPNIFVVFMSSELTENLTKQIGYLLFTSVILVIPALFLKLRWYFLFESIFMLCAPFEIGYVWIYKSTISDGFISSVLNTNIWEALELLMTIKWQIIILLIIWAVYYFIVFRKIENKYLFTRKYSLLTGTTIIIFNMLLFSAMYVTEYRQEKSYMDINKTIITDKAVTNDETADVEGFNLTAMNDKKSNFSEAAENLADNYESVYPLNIITTLIRNHNNNVTLNDMRRNIATFSYGAKQYQSPSEREIYIVIIGESARYGNFSINGYKRNTSPRLEKIPGIITYSDAYATSTVTEYALPLLLSRATPLNHYDAYKEKTFVDAFRECGFYTGWISNQSMTNPYIERITEDTDEAFITDYEFDSSENFDSELFPYIDSLLNRNEQKTFIVVHTLGSHFRYNFRYPKSFEQFTPALEGANDFSLTSDKNKELLINAYDNSILYTDFVLSEIINKIESKKCVSAVLFISDHAENLYDNGSHLIFHGSETPPVLEVHVPLFIWTSSLYNEIHPGKLNALKANANKKVSASNIFHSTLDIAGINYPGEKPEKSIASDSFKEDNVRYVYSANKEIIHFQ